MFWVYQCTKQLGPLPQAAVVNFPGAARGPPHTYPEDDVCQARNDEGVGVREIEV